MTCTTSHRGRPKALLVGLALALLTTLSAAADDTVKWTLRAQPSSGGTIEWETSSPRRDGVVSSGKVVAFDKNTDLDVWFRAKPGFEIASVQKDDQEFVYFLDMNDHFSFGPVGGSHKLTATFAPILPSGSFSLSAPVGDPNVPSMVDLTGSYTGTSPTKHARDYAFDVAMDETGKVAVMGTVEGIEPKGGGELSGAVGRVKTVNGEPTLDASGKFAGSRDGVAAGGTAKTRGPAELQGPAGDVAQGTMTYNAKAGGVPFKDKNVPMQMAVDRRTASNVRRAWSIRLNLMERSPSKGGKPYVAASAAVTLPNGDVLDFPEKKAKYTAKKGLKLKLRKGTNVTRVPEVVDKKTKLTITNMTLEKVGSAWRITGGRLQYRFLGQKGSADVLEFLDD